jgi:integrase
VERAGVPILRLHDLRHTAASIMHVSGEQARVVHHRLLQRIHSPGAGQLSQLLSNAFMTNRPHFGARQGCDLGKQEWA